MTLAAATASAAVTVSTSGGTIQIGSATGSNETHIDYKVADPNFGGADRITIQNTDGALLGIDIEAGDPGGCDYDPDNPNIMVSCPTSFGDIQATYGGGNDKFRVLNICMPTATVNLGNGTNDYVGAGCDASTITVSAGSGQDTLNGYSEEGSTVDVLNGGGGDDTMYGAGGDDVLHGGEGNDTVSGSGGNDLVFGDGGNDVVRGGAGNDTEDGGPGDDRIGFSPGVSHDDDQGADNVRGGDGADRLTLEDHAGGMTINLDGQANDGSAGEGDNIASDIEQIDGTDGNDVFIGSPGTDKLYGGSGNDDMHGAGGDDDVYGGSGDDRVYGDAGNDQVAGATGSDVVDGGPGVDQLSGDIASCTFSCSFDPDQLFARDGERDTVDCGGGADEAHVDGLDIVAFCALVNRQNLPAAEGPGGGATALGLVVARSIRLNALFARGLALRVNCAGACKVVAALSYRGRSLGAGRRTLTSAGTARLAVKVARRTRARVRRLRGKKLTLRVKVTAAGTTTTLTRKVTLKR